MSENQVATTAKGQDDGPASAGREGFAQLTRSGPSRAPTSGAMEGTARGPDSGLINLRALTQSGDRKPVSADDTDSLKIDMRAIARSAPTSTRMAVSTAPAAAAAAVVAPPAAASTATTTPPDREKKGSKVLWLALGAVATAAAVAFFAFSGLKKDDASTDPGNRAATPPAALRESAPPPGANPAAVAPVGVDPATPRPADTAAAPKVAAGPKSGPVAQPPPGGAAGGTAPVAGTPPPAAAFPAKEPAAPTPTVDPVHKPAGGNLDDVLGIGKEPSAKKKDDPAASNLPDRPDQMEVRSAVNGKLGQASSCVKGLDAPSSVSIMFGPSGTVSAVVVTSGPAKGTGAESCIKSAFQPAKVPASKKGASGNATLQP